MNKSKQHNFSGRRTRSQASQTHPEVVTLPSSDEESDDDSVKIDDSDHCEENDDGDEEEETSENFLGKIIDPMQPHNHCFDHFVDHRQFPPPRGRRRWEKPEPKEQEEDDDDEQIDRNVFDLDDVSIDHWQQKADDSDVVDFPIDYIVAQSEDEQTVLLKWADYALPTFQKIRIIKKGFVLELQEKRNRAMALLDKRLRVELAAKKQKFREVYHHRWMKMDKFRDGQYVDTPRAKLLNRLRASEWRISYESEKAHLAPLYVVNYVDDEPFPNIEFLTTNRPSPMVAAILKNTNELGFLRCSCDKCIIPNDQLHHTPLCCGVKYGAVNFYCHSVLTNSRANFEMPPTLTAQEVENMTLVECGPDCECWEGGRREEEEEEKKKKEEERRIEERKNEEGRVKERKGAGRESTSSDIRARHSERKREEEKKKKKEEEEKRRRKKETDAARKKREEVEKAAKMQDRKDRLEKKREEEAARPPRGCVQGFVRRGRQTPLIIFREADGRGWSLRTSEEIKAGTFVTEYVGEVLTAHEAAHLDSSYFISMRFGWAEDLAATNRVRNQRKRADTIRRHRVLVTDAQKAGNEARFINHSCEPNLVSVVAYVERHGEFYHRVAFFARRDIAPGEELTFNYFPSRKDWRIFKTMFPYCMCGTDSCDHSKEQVEEEERGREETEKDSDKEDLDSFISDDELYERERARINKKYWNDDEHRQRRRQERRRKKRTEARRVAQAARGPVVPEPIYLRGDPAEIDRKRHENFVMHEEDAEDATTLPMHHTEGGIMAHFRKKKFTLEAQARMFAAAQKLHEKRKTAGRRRSSIRPLSRNL